MHRGKMTPNRNKTLTKLEEDVKKRLFLVYNKPQKSSQVRLKYDAKIALKERLNKQGSK